MLNPLESLIELRNKYGIRITPIESGNIGALKSVELTIENQSWSILIHDEYDDLKVEHQLMCFYLVLRELETYLYEPDFLKWCVHTGSDPKNNQLLQYYRDLGRAVIAIEAILGTIDSQITHLDYELRTGIIRDLIAKG